MQKNAWGNEQQYIFSAFNNFQRLKQKGITDSVGKMALEIGLLKNVMKIELNKNDAFVSQQFYTQRKSFI